MSDDDLYVNDGANYDTSLYAQEDPDVKEQETKDAAMKASSYPVLGEIADWFEAQIENCPNIDNIQFDLVTIDGVTVDRKTSIEAQGLAFKLLKELLTEKSKEYEDFKNEH